MLPGINTQNLIGVINAVTDFSAFEDNKVTTALKKKPKTTQMYFYNHSSSFFPITFKSDKCKGNFKEIGSYNGNISTKRGIMILVLNLYKSH